MIRMIKSFKIFLIVFAVLASVIISPRAISAQNSDIELFLVAQKAFEDGFYDLSIRYVEQLLKEHPDTAKRIQAQLLLGQCYFFKSQYLKAYEIFQPLAQESEMRDATLYWLGETYLKAGDLKKSEENYQELISVFPNSAYAPQGYYSLGWVYFEQENYPKAREMFAKLIAAYPAHQLVEDAAFKIGESEYNQRQYENAISYFQKYVQQFPKSTHHPESYFYIAESYYYLENFLEAIAYYAKASDIAYDNKLSLMAKVSLGWSYLKIEKYDLSQKYFDEALAFSKEKGILSDDVYLGQANLYSETKEYDKALKAYTELIETFPNSHRVTEAYLGKGNSYYLLKNYSKAILAYQTIIDRYENSPQHKDIVEKALFGLAWSYLKSNNVDAAVSLFEKIKSQSANQVVQVSALTQIGDAYQDVEQYDKALQVYDEIIKAFPDSAYTDYIQYRQGVAFLKMGDIKAATLSFQTLEANFPKSRYVKDTKYYLAVAYSKQEAWGEAKALIQEFISHFEENKASEFLEEAYYILGLSQFGLKEYGQAKDTFQKIIKNYPQFSALVKNSELNIAKCLYQQGDFKEALKQFESISQKHSPADTAQEALLWIGDHYLTTSQWDQAISVFEQFATRFPGSDRLGDALYELAQAHQAKSDFDNAILEYKKITINYGKELYVKAQLSIAEIFSQKDNNTASIETYENIIHSSPEFKRDAYAKLASVYKNLRNYTQALETYKEALKAEIALSKIHSAEIQFYIADTYELSGNFSLAQEEYFKIPYLYPQETGWQVKAYLRIARIFEEEEKWTEAKKIYNKIIEFKTDELKFAQERLDWINQNHLE